MKWSKFARSSSDEFVEGDFNVIDDRTGFKVKASELQQQWDGLMVVNPEERNPQDFLRGVIEKAPTWGRPEQEDTFFDGSNDGSNL